MKNSTREGNKVYYVCSKGLKCPARRYILSPSDGSKDLLFMTEDGHEKHKSKTSCKGISKEAEEEIKSLVARGIAKPKQIFRALNLRSLPIPSEMQLQNYLKFLKRKSYPQGMGEAMELSIEPVDL